jgi:hypothetical protein
LLVEEFHRDAGVPDGSNLRLSIDLYFCLPRPAQRTGFSVPLPRWNFKPRRVKKLSRAAVAEATNLAIGSVDILERSLEGMEAAMQMNKESDYGGANCAGGTRSGGVGRWEG